MLPDQLRYTNRFKTLPRGLGSVGAGKLVIVPSGSLASLQQYVDLPELTNNLFEFVFLPRHS